MPMPPEAGQFLEISLDGAQPTLETISSLPQGEKLWVWDPRRNQLAFVVRTASGGLQIKTGDLEHPELYGISPEDVLKDALDLWGRVKAAETEQQNKFVQNASF